MENRYDEAAAAKAVAEWGVDEPLALRTYTAQLLGREPALVLHGGGNTSVKARARTLLGESIDVIHVKGSGQDLATIDPSGHPAVRLEPLRKLRALRAMSDEEMVNELRANLLDASAPTPSVETLLHAYLPARFVDHTHADSVLAVIDQPDAERIGRAVWGEGLVWVPYVMPGFELARRCADAYDAHAKAGRKADVIILEKHGIFTFGETAKESYARMIEAVSRAEGYVAHRRGTRNVGAVTANPAAEAMTLPILRGILARLSDAAVERGPILRIRATEPVLSFLARRDASELSQVGSATPDHVLRTKPTALFVESPTWDDPPLLAGTLESEVRTYASRYDAYFEEMSAAKKVSKHKLDPWPRIVLLPGLGLVAAGKTSREADAAADIYEHTMDVMVDATEVGRYTPVSRADLFDVEYWSLEQAKLKKAPDPPLGGCVALVTGAAAGIGRATAERFLELGAHVLLVDRKAQELEAAAAELDKRFARRAASFVADVAYEQSVEACFTRVCRLFGGIDVVVSNAGNAPEGALDTKEGEAKLRESLELNLLAHNHVARHASAVMKAQGNGGCLLFNASKSAFNPGPNFGPYAVAKAALVALMRQLAIDLAPAKIRSNAVNADRIRTELFGGGVLERRAAARGLSVDDYFRANLLGREVTARDVADAFAFLAGARATTGCVVTVDGGNASAFPR